MTSLRPASGRGVELAGGPDANGPPPVRRRPAGGPRSMLTSYMLSRLIGESAVDLEARALRAKASRPSWTASRTFSVV